ncbi:MAG TPA: transglycosylase domain-containing protein, partial [Actinomycetota bacterium]|nr:transglycosylase domain-containing protein [Actinomycetota bacterium]
MLAVLLGAAGFVALLLPGVAATVWMTGRIERRLDRLEREIDLTFPRFPERSTIYARDGRRLATLFLEENRKVVRLRRVNEVTRKAVLAIEDSDFYEHDGIDRRAVVRALVANVAEGRIEQGASTITQQLARNA